MSLTVRLNMRDFNRGMRELRRTLPNKTIPQICNQVGLDLAVRNYETTPPTDDPDARRLRIKQLLTEPLSTKIKLFKSGKRKGQFGRDHSKARQLQRVHLISNYYRGKYGKPGLYGGASHPRSMMLYAAAVKHRRQVGVGVLKAPWMPVIRALNQHAYFKVSYRRLFAKISRWPGSKGDGTARPAREGWSPKALLRIALKVRGNQEGKIGNLQHRTMQQAIDWKAGKMLRQAERNLQTVINQAGAGP